MAASHIDAYDFDPSTLWWHCGAAVANFPPLPQYEFVDEMVVHGCVAGIGRRRGVSDGLLMFRVVVARVLLPYLLKIQPITHHQSPPPNRKRMSTNKWNGWNAAMGSNAEAVAIYRIALGVMLLVELTTRFQYLHPFYSDEG